MAIKMATPCFLFFTALPKVKQSAAGMSRMEMSSTKLVNPLGFSKGWAEFTSVKPPPFEPVCLMAI